MCLIVFLISCFLQCSIADEILLWKSKRTFIEADCIKNYRYLISNFAENKILLKDIELASLVALSYFPELKNIEIEKWTSSWSIILQTELLIQSYIKKK